MDCEKEIESIENKIDDLLKANRLLRISNLILSASLLIHIVDHIIT